MMTRLLRRLGLDGTRRAEQDRDTAAFREELRQHRAAATREAIRLRNEPLPPGDFLRQIRPWWEEPASEEPGP